MYFGIFGDIEESGRICQILEEDPGAGSYLSFRVGGSDWKP